MNGCDCGGCLAGETCTVGTDPTPQHARAQGFAEGQWEAMRAAACLGELRCASCNVARAVCIDAYEASTPVLPACDDCCEHGCEDGRCEQIEDVREEANS